MEDSPPPTVEALIQDVLLLWLHEWMISFSKNNNNNYHISTPYKISIAHRSQFRVRLSHSPRSSKSHQTSKCFCSYAHNVIFLMISKHNKTFITSLIHVKPIINPIHMKEADRIQNPQNLNWICNFTKHKNMTIIFILAMCCTHCCIHVLLMVKIAKHHYFLKLLVFYYCLRNIQQCTTFLKLESMKLEWNSSLRKSNTIKMPHVEHEFSAIKTGR